MRTVISQRRAGVAWVVLALSAAATLEILSGGTHVAAATKPTPASVFVSPTGNDANPCTSSRPCASFNRGYQAAPPGAVIEIAGGTYRSQVIAYVPSRNGTKPVTFVAGGKVIVEGNLEFHGSAVRLQGTATGSIADWRRRTYSFEVSGYTSVEGDSPTRFPLDVTIEGLHTGNLGTYTSRNVVVRDVEVGPALLDGSCSRVENRIGANGAASPTIPVSVVWDRVVIHEQNRTVDAANRDCHYGGLQLLTGNGITIRNSVFSQNVVYNIAVGPLGGPAATNVTLENNMFGCPVENSYTPNGTTTCDGQGDIQFGGYPFSNWLVRHNSFVSGLQISSGSPTFANVRVVGNVAERSACLPGATYEYNAWMTSRCSTSDASIRDLPFVSSTPGSEDFTLKPGTRPVGLVVKSGKGSDLALDAHGRQRPVNANSDAGAVQRENAAIDIARSIGEVRLGEKREDVLAFYGKPRRTTTSKGLVTDTFVVHRSALLVASRGGRVVRVSTTSGYYTTLGGVGPGSTVASAGALARGKWIDCLGAYRRVVGGRVVHVRTDRKKSKIVAVTISRRSEESRC
jgi:hypothetical protein